jgi:diguanylate cyclase (GGDEF)-like protein
MDIILIGTDEQMLAEAEDALGRELTVTTCRDPETAIEIMRRRSIRLAVVFATGLEGDGLDFVRNIRTTFFQEPIQIIAGTYDPAHARKMLEYGADDAFLLSSDIDERAIRIIAAAGRLMSQIRVFGNLDFFMKAAKQEEELSSRILDQHMVLKEAYQNIESVNQELEETNKQLEKIARFDTLSGLLNRASLFTAIDTEIDRALRTSSSLSGIMIDIDNFKTINDTYGHLHGDRVIAEIGRRLTDMLRKYDLAGRYGGEEFFVILPNSTLNQAFIIAERFRKRMELNPFDFSGDSLVVTASFGIAEYKTAETREGWLSRCDAQLYRAKAAGRNRVSGK